MMIKMMKIAKTNGGGALRAVGRQNVRLAATAQNDLMTPVTRMS
jgi:hypothetical protein